jgi:hypothetical protein
MRTSHRVPTIPAPPRRPQRPEEKGGASREADMLRLTAFVVQTEVTA